jgi:undecaprenyl-diphosphatase
MLVFSILPFLNLEFKKFKYVWIIFCILVSFSRVYLGLHFLSDVFLGGLIGYFIGLFVLSYFKKKIFF